MKRTASSAFIRRFFAPLLIALVGLLSTAHTAWACPTCSEAAAANDPEHEHMVKGYFYSILFMMGMPYTVFTCFCVYMYFEVKKARARNAAQNSAGEGGPKKPLAPAAAAAELPRAEPVERGELVEV
ncbi:MAG TPA: hypothetical protein VFE46_16770 [Pirellulales bacterium]|jgi:uncharacterized membrane protein|nr:hypothetical protein [Pirellulales bacterium]